MISMYPTGSVKQIQNNQLLTSRAASIPYPINLIVATIWNSSSMYLDEKNTKIWVVCGTIYILYNVDFHIKDKGIWQIKISVEQLVVTMIYLELMTVHSTSYWPLV